MRDIAFLNSGNTGLVGAVIDSKADASKNRLETGSITTEDLQNSAHYEVDTWGVGTNTTLPWQLPDGKDKAADGKILGGIGQSTGTNIIPNIPQSESGGSSSTTKSAVAEGTVIITDPTAQMNLTGQTASEAIDSLNRDTENAHTGALPQNPNLQGIVGTQEGLNMLAMQAGLVINNMTSDISGRFAKAAEEAKDEAGAAKWGKGGSHSMALAAVGTIIKVQYQNGEGLEAAMGMLASYLATGEYQKFTAEATKGITDPVEKAWLTNTLNNALMRGTGALVGGETGGNTAIKQPPAKPDSKEETKRP